MSGKKDFWIRLCLLNLSIVALFGFALRSKILFPIPWMDYRHILSAHSHFAFGGWVGLSLATLLIYNMLPPAFSAKRVYQWILGGIQVSSLGMAVSFPFGGYYSVSIFFSTLFIVVTYWFGIVYIRDLLKIQLRGAIRMLAITALLSLMASAAGPFLLSYIMITNSTDSILYRDAIYTFLHFQYNGFFTLAIMALFFHELVNRGLQLTITMRRFAIFLSLSVLPALFLSLLWHGNKMYYILAGVGCLMVLASLLYFYSFIRKVNLRPLFTSKTAWFLGVFSLASFALKMLLNVGTIIPQLGHAVYGDRPVIIGFLHLVFLAFVSFYILSTVIEEKYFSRNGRVPRAPFYVFGAGVIANELLLMLQGLGILFKTNSDVYSWLLWFASIVLFIGGVMIAVEGYRNKKATGQPVAPIAEY